MRSGRFKFEAKLMVWLLFAFIAIALFVGLAVPWLLHQVEVDGCLDAGGAYDHQHGACVAENSLYDGLPEALEELGDRGVTLGDRAVDILAASANGLPSAGVPWGYGSERELRKAGAEVLLTEANELSQFSGVA